MNRLEHLLSIVREECSELSQRVSKAMRFGLREVQDDPISNPDLLDNQMRCDVEFHDLLATMEMAGLITIETVSGDRELPNVPFIRVAPTLIAAKKEKVERFLELSRKMGTLTDDVVPEEPSVMGAGSFTREVPVFETLLRAELEAACDADPSGFPCKTCGKSSIMHAFKKVLKADAR